MNASRHGEVDIAVEKLRLKGLSDPERAYGLMIVSCPPACGNGNST